MLDFRIENLLFKHLILLEFSLFLEPRMDIAKYALAEIYNFEKTYETAFKILDSIPEKSFFSLAGNLKKLTIIKTSGKDVQYKSLLFKIYNIWPDNKFVLYSLASYYKSKSKYQMSIKIHKKILDNYESNDSDLFLYASNLDKIGKWKEARVLFLQLLKKKLQCRFQVRLSIDFWLVLQNFQ